LNTQSVYRVEIERLKSAGYGRGDGLLFWGMPRERIPVVQSESNRIIYFVEKFSRWKGEGKPREVN